MVRMHFLVRIPAESGGDLVLHASAAESEYQKDHPRERRHVDQKSGSDHFSPGSVFSYFFIMEFVVLMLVIVIVFLLSYSTSKYGD